MPRTIVLFVSVMFTVTIGLPAQGGAPACGVDANNAACRGNCPRCGSCLVPVCRCYCTTKKVPEPKYTCLSEDLCIPGIMPIGKWCRSCECGSESATGGETANDACPASCGRRCVVRTVNKLVKHPATKEEPVRKCAVEWVCPKCNCHGNCLDGASAPGAASPAPSALPAGSDRRY